MSSILAESCLIEQCNGKKQTNYGSDKALSQNWRLRDEQYSKWTY